MQLCLIESRGAASEVGMAAIDGNTLFIDQLIDTSGYGKTLRAIALLNPDTIIISDSGSRQSSPSRLYVTLQEECASANYVKIPRAKFDEEAGWNGLRRLAFADQIPALEIVLSRKHYALACLAALLQQPEFAGLLPACLHVKPITMGDCLMALDFFTVRNLEMTRSPNPKGSLLSCLDQCQTRMGQRMLRMNVLQPPADLATIQGRQGCIRELDGHVNFISLRQELARLPDIDRLLNQLIRVSQQDRLSQAIILKRALNAISLIASLLHPVEHEILSAIRDNLEEAKRLLKPIIDATLGDEVLQTGMLEHHLKCYAVKGKSSLLEVARRTLSENMDDVYEYARVLGEALKMEVGVQWTKGAYSLRIKSEDALPAEFIRNGRMVTTMELCKLNERIAESIQEIQQLSDRILAETFESVREHLPTLYRATESIAYLDFLVCASLWGRDKTVPIFSDDCLAFREARNPILGASAIPNSLLLNREHCFMVIHGGNGTGKSTFLRQTAYLQILAQMGWSVPAEFASIRIADRLLARLGSDDDFESNSSTLKLEMKEMSYALQEATDRSLLLLDELGRGTSVLEGQALTAALSEHFILHRNSFCFLVTHFDRVIHYLNMFNAVVLVHLDDHHRVIPGPIHSDHYGMRMAERVGLPEALMEAARKALEKLAAQRGEDEDGRVVSRLVAKRKLIYVTAQRIRAIGEDSEALKRLKEEFLDQLDQIN